MSTVLLSTLGSSAFASPAVVNRPLEVEFCRMEDTIKSLEPDSAEERQILTRFLAGRQVIYVSGYQGCRKTEFEDNRAMITDIDHSIPVTMICPPSAVAISDNVEFIVSNVRRLFKKNGSRKIVLVGRSKGAAEVLRSVATHPEILESSAVANASPVSHVVLMTGAIGGSVLTDLALGTDPQIVGEWVKFKAANGISDSWLSRLAEGLLLGKDSPGFKSLSTEEARKRNEGLLLTIDAETRRKLKERVFFVSAYRDGTSEDMPFYLKNVFKFMKQRSERNDGLVFESAQVFPELGTHLLSVRKAGHFSLAGPYEDGFCRQEFMRLLLLRLAGPI